MRCLFGEWPPWGGIISGLGGPFQIVPRAELLAFALALEHWEGDLCFITDHLPLYDGWRSNRHSRPRDGANQDLWARMAKALRTWH
eukprot:2992558-Pyramimonas_sp.AAC.1